MDHLLIVTTGGTIDKIYFDAKSDYQIGDPQIGDLLHSFHVPFRFETVSLLRKDSLEMTDADRELVARTIAANGAKHVLVTHGTDTMVETAQALAHLDDKTIVLTGALLPARYIDTDAVFNIGCGIAAVQTASPGVYIAMNGKVWPHDAVRKNRQANRFEPV